MNDEWRQMWANMEDAQDVLRQESEALSRRWQVVQDQRSDLIDQRIASTPVEVWLQDEEQLRWLLDMARGHMGAHRLSQQLQRVDRRDAHVMGIDGRPGYEGQGLPVLTLMLTKGQAVDDLEQVIREWTTRWRLGRPEMPIRILEDTLSAGGQWMLWFNLDADKAALRLTAYGKTVEPYAGDLRGALRYAADNLWYEKGY